MTHAVFYKQGQQVFSILISSKLNGGVFITIVMDEYVFRISSPNITRIFFSNVIILFFSFLLDLANAAATVLLVIYIVYTVYTYLLAQKFLATITSPTAIKMQNCLIFHFYDVRTLECILGSH